MLFPHRTPNWPWPVLGAILLLFTTSRVSTQKMTYSKDASWVRLDANFPSTSSLQNPKQNDRFYYKRGTFSANLGLTEATLSHLETEPADSYHVSFSIFRNRLQCPKYLAIGRESVTNIEDNAWVPLSRVYSAEDFADFSLRLSAWSDATCNASKTEESMVALKHLTLSYNRIIKGASNAPDNETSTFQPIPSLESVKAEDRSKWNTYFTGCSTVGACSIQIPGSFLKRNVTSLFFWHAEPLTLSTQGTKTQKTITTKAKEAGNFKMDPDPNHDENIDVTVQIQAKDDSLVGAIIGPEISKSQTNSLQLTSEASKFTAANPNSVLLQDYSKPSFALLPSSTIVSIPEQCFILHYLLDPSQDPESALPSRFTVSLFIYSPELTYVNRYALFTFRPVASGAQETVPFCLDSFLYAQALLSGQIRLKLDLDGPEKEPKDGQTQKLALVALKVDDNPQGKPKPKPIKPLGFIRHGTSPKWIASVPHNLGPIDQITLSTIKYPTSYQIQGVWLRKDVNIIKTTARFTVSIPETRDPALREALIEGLQLNLNLCDELGDCISSSNLDLTRSKLKPETSFDYAFAFDSLPPGQSLVHLVLEVELPALEKSTQISISLINFGDPCLTSKCGQDEDTKGETCQANPETDKANTEVGEICKCPAGFSGEGCTIRDYCLDGAAESKCKFKASIQAEHWKCRNNAANTGFECPCDETNLLKILNNKGDCQLDAAFPVLIEDPKEATKASIHSATLDLSTFRPHLYDLCLKFTSPSQIRGFLTASLLTNGQEYPFIGSIPFAASKDKTEVITVCLSDWFDLQSMKLQGKKLQIAAFSNESTLFSKGKNFKIFGKKLELEAKKQIRASDALKMIAQENPQFIRFKVERSSNPGTKTTTFSLVTSLTKETDSVEPFSSRLYGEWIHLDRSLDGALIDSNVIKLENSNDDLSSSVYICPPRSGALAPDGTAVDDCRLLDRSSKLSSILASFPQTVNRFQIVLQLQTEKPLTGKELKAIKPLNLQVSVWEPCALHDGVCQNGGKCKVPEPFINGATFTCECGAQKAQGAFCQFSRAPCTEAKEKSCKAHGGICQIIENGPRTGNATCTCPPGYELDDQSDGCHRIKLETRRQVCTPENPSDCFLDNVSGLLNPSDPFPYLPINFPAIPDTEKDTSKELFYSIQSSSKLTLNMAELNPTPDAQDVCISFKYFVPEKSKLILRFNDQLDLLAISGTRRVPEIGPSASLGLSDATDFCLGAYLPPGSLSNVTSFSLDFISSLPSGNEDSVAVELVPFDDGAYFRLQAEPNHPQSSLSFLSRTSTSLNISEATKLSFQWPGSFPSSRWIEREPSTLQFTRKHTETIETALLESSWIDRPLSLAQKSPIYHNFKLSIASDLSLETFKLDIRLLDISRHQLGPLVASITPKIAKGPKIPPWYTKELVIPVNTVEIKKGSLYRIQFKITFQDAQSQRNDPLFSLSDISFGDPCLDVKEREETGEGVRAPISFKERTCYGVSKDLEVVEDKSVKCHRLVDQVSGQVDYECPCAQGSGLSGKDCHVADYCIFKHKFKVPTLNHSEPNLEVQASGNSFCSGDDPKSPKAACVRVFYQSYNFMCNCPDVGHSFDFVEKDCIPIDACVLHPCNFETQLCRANSTSPLGRDCECKPRFEPKGDDCQKIPDSKLQIEECNVKEVCLSADPKMRCLTGPSGHSVCACARGFRLQSDQTSVTCQSNMCAFDGRKRCPQGCRNLDKEPYFECTCEQPDYTLENRVDPGTNGTVFECKLKETASKCDNCTATKYNVCLSGRCTCLDDFELNSDGVCIPKESFKLPACPGPNYKLDPTGKSYVCDCSNSSLVPGTFKEDPNLGSSCLLAKSACDSGGLGRASCSSRQAGCLVSPLAPGSDFSCVCALGTLFPDGERVKSRSQLETGPEKTGCIDICSLSNSVCATIGGRCNSLKLWTLFRDKASLAKLKPEEYCSCVPGTFYNKKARFCVQEPEILSLNITLFWSNSLQKAFEEIRQLLLNLHQTQASLNPSPTFIDPIGTAHAQLRSQNDNLKATKAVEDAWSWQIKESLLLEEVEKLLFNFKLLETRAEDGLGREVTIVEMTESTHAQFKLNLAVKIPEIIRKSAPDEEESDQAQADGAQADGALPYDLSPYGVIRSNCLDLPKQKGVCIVPYMALVLGATEVKPEIHKPCNNPATCSGMSNCRPQGAKSQFTCECDAQYFEIESESTFRSSIPSVVLKNERCIAKTLCPSKCLGVNRACLEKAPRREGASEWIKEVECTCEANYALVKGGNSTGEGECTGICQILNCNLENSKCQINPISGQAECDCKEDYYGDRCQHKTPSNTWWIVGVTVLGVLALVFLALALFFCLCKR